MMSGGNFTDGVSKVGAVLGDITNQPVKRGISLISGDTGLKSGERYAKKVVSEDGDSRFAKQVCLGVETLVKEKGKTKCGDNTGKEYGSLLMKDEQVCDSSPTNSETDTSQENIVSVVSHRPNKTKEMPNLLDGIIKLVKSGSTTQSIGEVDDASRDSCASSGLMPTNSGQWKKESDDEGRLTSNIIQRDPVSEGFSSHVCTSDEKDLCVGKLASSKCGSVEWSKLPRSQGSKLFELDKCTALKADSCANLNTGSDMLKACCCSFCLKAAYIWSDLHYQDIKGRIAASKKSQKEAAIMHNKYARAKQTDIHDHGNSNRSSKLESDLSGQWRSLFRHMEDIFVHESSQLQADFVALKDLKENCKMDLERTTGMPSDKY